MIIVRVEVQSANAGRTTEVARMVITNDETSTDPNIGHYHVRTERVDPREGPVTNFVRRNTIWSLIRTALDNLYPEPFMTNDDLNLIAKTANALTRATEQLNAHLRVAEKTLAECHLGVTASVPLSSPTDPNALLTFGKFDDGWRLSVTVGSARTPLTNASRELRLRAVALLPALLTALLEAAETEHSRVEGAVQQLETFIKSMRP